MASSNAARQMALANEERRVHHRFIEITYDPLSKPLHYILKKMVGGKDPTENVNEYLERVRQKKVRYDKSQKEKIVSDLTGESFDITLCYKIIQEFWDGVLPRDDVAWTTDDTLENCLKKIKENRNEVFHSAGFKKEFFEARVDEIRDLLEKTWLKIGSVLGTDTSSEISNMKEDIRRIKEEPLEDIHEQLNELKDLLDTEGIPSMKEYYKECLSRAPDVHLLEPNPEDRSSVLVQDVFTEMHIIGDRRQEISYKEWLTELDVMHREKQKTSKLLLVEGVAGVGKTTITKKLILDWASGYEAMDGLSDYKMIFYMQFREKREPSMSMLCLSNLPALNKKVNPKYVKMLLEGNKMMFVCDGMDEKNAETMEVFKRILEYGERHPITVVCTTRPQEIEKLRSMLPPHFSFLRIQVVGIPIKKRGAFIERYFRAKMKNKNPEFLLLYLRKTSSRLQDHWRFPFNLMCLVMLWILEPDKINSLSTATELFIATHEALVKKLESRHPNIPHHFHENVLEVIKTLSQIALKNLGSGNILVTTSSLQNLKNECKKQKLLFEAVAGIFLSQEASWSNKTDCSYRFPHNAFQDFYAAMCVAEKLEAPSRSNEEAKLEMGTLLRKMNYRPQQIEAMLYKITEDMDQVNPPVSTRSILEDITEDNQEIKCTIMRSQNMLIHLTGLLYYNRKALTEARATELLELLQESGIKDETQWLDLLEMTKCDEKLCEFIAQKVRFGNEIRITDARVGAFAAILPFKKGVFDQVLLQLTSDTEKVPRLKEMLNSLAEKGKMFDLFFYGDFRNPTEGGSTLDDVIQKFRGRIRYFKGQLSPATLEKRSFTELEKLWLSLGDGAHYSELIPHLNSLGIRFPRLEWFALHIPVGQIDVTLLRPLPQIESLRLFISGIDDEEKVDWAIQAIRALQPVDGSYSQLRFPGLGKNPSLCRRLLEGLTPVGGKREIRTSTVFISPIISHEERLKMINFARKEIRCDFMHLNDEDVW